MYYNEIDLLAVRRRCHVFSQAEDMQQQIIRETFHLVSKRDDNVCNFLEGGRQVSLFAVILYDSRIFAKQIISICLIFHVCLKRLSHDCGKQGCKKLPKHHTK